MSNRGSFLAPAGSEKPADTAAQAKGATPQTQVAQSQAQPAGALAYADSHPVSASDVLRWNACGVREDVIIDRIDRSDAVFHLTAADENQLRDKGISEAVIREMKATARR